MDSTEQETPRLPVGVSDFKELIEENYFFVDKTSFIKEVMQDGAKVILITRPRHFGKTLNLSMLHYFLQIQSEQNLFGNLTISKDEPFCNKHQNKYPVIFVSFKDIKLSSYQEAYKAIVVLMKNLYAEHDYLLNDDILRPHEKALFHSVLNQKAETANLHEAIQQLSLYLVKKFGIDPIILIDEYDTPIQEAYLRGYYQPMIDLMRSIFGHSLKDNKCMRKAVITGITRIAQESLFSGVNNFEAYSVLKSKYGQYFGFTEPEVIDLIEKTGNQISLDIVREWYNGYRIGSHLVYNPWSILMCLKNEGEVGPHWLNTSSNDLVRTLVEKGSFRIREQFELLLQGESIQKPLMENLIFPDLENDEEAVWSLLLYTGYLTVLSSARGEFELLGQIVVPNKEVMYIYDKIIVKWFKKNDSLSSYKDFVGALIAGNIDIFKLHLAEYLMASGSYFDFNKNTSEQVFHSFMLGLVVGLKENYIIRLLLKLYSCGQLRRHSGARMLMYREYTPLLRSVCSLHLPHMSEFRKKSIQSNQESGLGRLDVVFIPKDNKRDGILLEFKVGDKDKLVQKAQEALQQIKDKEYLATFKNHGVKSVLAIGMAFCGKHVELAHELIEIE